MDPTRRPLELLAVNDPHPSEVVVTARATAERPPGGTGHADDPATAERPATSSAGRVARVAALVSHMALGAMLTLLALWATGTWSARPDPDTAPQRALSAPTGEPASRPDLPTTGQEAVQRPPSGDRAADAMPADLTVADIAVPPAQRPHPVQVEIPAIGVSARVIPLGLDGDGVLEVPEDFAETGWWTGGPEPGEMGPSVIVGHVDSYRGPAVFFALDQLVHDDAIVVTRTDGSSATFAVRSTRPVDKDAFPTDLVYGPTEDAQLRLITCDGDFADGSYLGNLIVTAELVREDPPPSGGIVY